MAVELYRRKASPPALFMRDLSPIPGIRVERERRPENWLLHADRAAWGNKRALYPPGWFPFLALRVTETSKWHPEIDEGAGVIRTH